MNCEQDVHMGFSALLSEGYQQIVTKCGQNGQGQNGHFRFRERGHCSLYINNVYIIVEDIDSLFSILTNDQMTKMTAQVFVNI